MFLDYFALVVLLLGLIALFYTFIFIHDIPYEIAKRRNHPQKEASHVAGWLSLFTLHAIWPIIFIWAISKQGTESTAGEASRDENLSRRLGELETKLRQLEDRCNSPSKKVGDV